MITHKEANELRMIVGLTSPTEYQKKRAIKLYFRMNKVEINVYDIRSKVNELFNYVKNEYYGQTDKANN